MKRQNDKSDEATKRQSDKANMLPKRLLVCSSACLFVRLSVRPLVRSSALQKQKKKRPTEAERLKAKYRRSYYFATTSPLAFIS